MTSRRFEETKLIPRAFKDEVQANCFDCQKCGAAFFFDLADDSDNPPKYCPECGRKNGDT